MKRIPRGFKDVNGEEICNGDTIEAWDIADGCASTGYPFKIFVNEHIDDQRMDKYANRCKAKIIKKANED